MESSSSEVPEDVKTIQLLAKGILETYEPPLATIGTHLKELTGLALDPNLALEQRWDLRWSELARKVLELPHTDGTQQSSLAGWWSRVRRAFRAYHSHRDLQPPSQIVMTLPGWTARSEKQEAVHSMLTSERRKLEDLQNDAMLDALLADIATNKEKLTSISNSMMTLHKRVQSLQTRAANVEKAAKAKAAAHNKTPPSPNKAPVSPNKAPVSPNKAPTSLNEAPPSPST